MHMLVKSSLSRLLHLFFVMLGVSAVVFSLLQLAPGDAATALLGPQASEANKAALREELGLNEPLAVQYGLWLGRAVQGDFGTSIVSRDSVLKTALPRYGNSLILAAAALMLAMVFGISVGVAAAVFRGGLFDRISSAAVQVFGALPPFWLGLVLVYFISLQLRWLPATGMTKSFGGGDFKDVVAHLILPAITAAAASAAVIARMVRSVFIDVLSSEYILVARARGVGRMRLLFRHALPNCLPEVLNIIGLQLGYLIGGALFTEVVFAWPGIGQLLYQSILSRDVAVVQACVLLIALSFVLINLAVDIASETMATRMKQS
jgi:peptide/nickel transport system permease protein